VGPPAGSGLHPVRGGSDREATLIDPASLAGLDLATPSGVRSALATAGLRLRPSRGQHFLISRRVLDRILAAAEVRADEVVLEIGAGIGTLTAALARAGAAVVAVEVDARFIPILRAVCAPYPTVRIVHADAMRLTADVLPGLPVKVVANLPYAIASPLLVNLLEAGWGRRYVVMVQEEVAERIVALQGTPAYGLLSVAVRAHARASIITRVARSAFFPPPQVTSAVVRLDVPDDPPVPRVLVPALMAVARAAFGQRRKMLRTALRAALTDARSAAVAESLCREAGIDPHRRGETLSLDEFTRLARAAADRGEAAGPGSPEVG
jgi:16S rRNA (adenine1518-N6/adenine1519-N6)-dimethyltransferase